MPGAQNQALHEITGSDSGILKTAWNPYTLCKMPDYTVKL